AFVLCLGLTAPDLHGWPVWRVRRPVGLAGAAAAVPIAPKRPGNLCWAGAVAGLAFFVALRSGWDTSVPFLFGTLSVVAFAAASLLVMPQIVRRVAVSLFIIYHFA